MTVNQILTGLERSDATGQEADQVARLGFLEWAFTLPGEASAKAARAALDCPEARNADSAAARAFVGFLEQATRPISSSRVRRRRLH